MVDLASAHGTWLNRVKLEPWKFTLMPVGSVLRLGTSSRTYVLQGPDDLRGEELESPALAAKRAAAAAATKRGPPAGTPRQEGLVGSVNDSEEAATAAEQRLIDDVEDMELNESTVHANDLPLLKQLQQHRASLDKARAAQQRLLDKQAASARGGAEFSEGQARALAGLQAGVAAAEARVEEGEERIRSRMRARLRKASQGGAGGGRGPSTTAFKARAGTAAVNEGSRQEKLAMQMSDGDFDDAGVPLGGASAVKRAAWAPVTFSSKRGAGRGRSSSTLSFLKTRPAAAESRAASTSAPAPIQLGAVESASSLRARLEATLSQVREAESAHLSAAERVKAQSAQGQVSTGEELDTLVQAGALQQAEADERAAAARVAELQKVVHYLRQVLRVVDEPHDGARSEMGGPDTTAQESADAGTPSRPAATHEEEKPGPEAGRSHHDGGQGTAQGVTLQEVAEVAEHTPVQTAPEGPPPAPEAQRAGSPTTVDTTPTPTVHAPSQPEPRDTHGKPVAGKRARPGSVAAGVAAAAAAAKRARRARRDVDIHYEDEDA